MTTEAPKKAVRSLKRKVAEPKETPLKKKVEEPTELVSSKEDVKKVKEKRTRKAKEQPRDQEVEVPETVEQVPKEETEEEPKPKKERRTKREKKEATEEGTVKQKSKPRKESERKPKKINTKATSSKKMGINISVPKVKTLVSDTINQEQVELDTYLKTYHSELSEEQQNNFKFGDIDSKYRGTIRNYLYAHHINLAISGVKKTLRTNAELKTEYTKALKVAQAEHAEQHKNILFDKPEFNIRDFDSNFSPLLKAVYAEADANLEGNLNLAGKELYTFLISFLGKRKVKFNKKSKIFITLYIEYMLTDLIKSAIYECVNEGDKTIKPAHIHKNLSFSNLLRSLDSYEYMSPDYEKQESTKKNNFGHHVAELCRSIKVELAEKNKDDLNTSVYTNLNINKPFKYYCSDLIRDLVILFAEVTRAEIASRKVKTVNISLSNTVFDIILSCSNSYVSEGIYDFINERSELFERYNAEKKEKKRERAALAEEEAKSGAEAQE
jgi:hypothetical protein